MPTYSVELGISVAGDQLYVGRAKLPSGEIVPGMVSSRLGGCHILIYGSERIAREYEVLICRDCDNLTWRHSYTSSEIPCGAIIGGKIGTKPTEVVYIARGRIPDIPEA